MGNYEYPTEEQLKIIQEWDLSLHPVMELIEYIRSLWWMPNWGFKLKDKRVLRLELHTGGWSGNEDIIHVLEQNYYFWYFLEESTVGGHYWFTIMPQFWKKE
mgnify:CR=1 FL=1